jgi:DegV family protein with EDD domain
MYLKRGGRISGAKAVIGTMLRLKPVIEITKEGKLEIIRKEMGMKKAFKSIVSEIKENYTFAKTHFKAVVVHTDNLDGAKELQQEIKQNFGFEPEIRVMGPIIGAHVGPNALALTFTSNEPRKY